MGAECCREAPAAALGAVVVTVGRDGRGVHQPQLVGQLVPALVLVEQYQHAARRMMPKVFTAYS